MKSRYTSSSGAGNRLSREDMKIHKHELRRESILRSRAQCALVRQMVAQNKLNEGWTLTQQASLDALVHRHHKLIERMKRQNHKVK